MKKILISSLILLSLVGCSKPKEEVKETQATKFKLEYESLNDKYQKITIKEKNPIVYSNIDEIIDIIDNKSGLIYFGYPECTSCRDNISVLIEAAKQTGLKKIYYLNTKGLDINDSKYETIKKYVNNFNGMKLIFVQNQENIKSIEENDDDYKQKSSDEKDDLLKLYRNSIHEMLDDLCDQSC